MPMFIHSTAPSREGLHDWFVSMPGSLVLAAEGALLDEALQYLFGYHLVQVGVLGGVDLLSRSRILHRVVIDIDGGAPQGADSALRGAPGELPVTADSVDVVVLPHVLEFEASPHAALREAGRVLVPEGHLVVVGFNPWSLFGFWRLVRARRGGVPWVGQFLGLRRLCDWLALLDFDVERVHRCFFRPPLAGENLLRRLSFMERLGPRLWPYFSGTYLVVARKRVVPLTPMRPRWKPRRRLVQVGLAEPSTRGTSGV